MKRSIMALALALCMLMVVPMAGCTNGGDEWSEYSVYEMVSGSGNKNDGADDKNNTASKNDTNKNDSSKNNTSSKKDNGKNDTGKQPSGNGITTSVSGKDKNADYTVSGKVTVSVNTSRPTDYEAMFDSFQAVYKKVDLEVKYFSDSSDGSKEYILKQASIGKLPDVVFDDTQEMPTYVSQGLVYPLDDFIKNDPDVKYIPSNILDTYKYGGKLYALPNSVHFYCIQINEDLADELNISMPALNWTTEDFKAFLKKGSTDKYAGVEELFGNDTLAATLAPNYNTNVTIDGFNYKTNKFDLKGSYASALKDMIELRKYPNLEAFQLRASGEYAKKFGSSNIGDSEMATKLGKTLAGLDVGTWSETLLQNYKFKMVLHPFPQTKANPGRMPIHVDHSFMTSSAKNPKAAFQLLRFITYSTEGNLARLGMYDKANKDKYALSSNYYIPVTRHPDVIAKFNTLNVGEVVNYFYKNLDKGYRADPKKTVPGFRETWKEICTEEMDKLTEGIGDVDAKCAELEPKINKALSDYITDFNKKLTKVQAEFKPRH